MRILQICLMLSLGSPVFAQMSEGPYKIKGKFSKVKTGKVFLTVYSGDTPQKDSAEIKNGQFEFKGKITDPAMAVLYRDSQKDDWRRFYVEAGNTTLSGEGETLKKLEISGSTLNKDDEQLKAMLKPIDEWEERNYEVYKKAYDAKNTQVMDSLDGLDETITQQKRTIVGDFVRQKPGSVRSSMAIEENFGYYAEASDVEPLYNALTDKIKNTGSGVKVKKMLDVYKTVAVGMPAPDITQPGPDGNNISLSSLKGKYVLVDFWASWCGPCRKENPNLVKAYNQYKDKGLAIFGVSYDTKKDKWEAAIQKDGLTWQHVSDLKGWQNASSATYYIRAIPSNVLIDKEGNIIAKNLMGKKLYDRLAQLLP